MALLERIEAGADEAPRRPRESLVSYPPSSELAFPGCKPVRLPREELELYDGRLEFWDGATETAWVCEPNSPYHEKPGGALPSLVERIAQVRGSPITCYGSMDLMVRNEGGLAWRILQADQSVYLHPGRARLPGAVAMEVGEHDLPDVVLEVDHTTDVYRGKLRLYEAWGFPEVWVEVPNYRAASRPKRRRAGLTIHVLEGDVYRESPESRAFPGWSAEELHVAFNERVRSERTCAVLERVGSALGAREGTGPDDDPMLRSLRGQSRMEGRTEGRAEGRMEGRTEGRAEGRTEGRAEGRMEGRTEGRAEGRTEGRAEGRTEGREEGRAGMVRAMLSSRGIGFSEDFPADVPGFAESPEAAVVEAALGCDSERDFHARIASGSGPRR